MLILHKVLPLVVLPLGFSLVLVVLGAVLRRWWLVWCGVVWLWVMSTPAMGDVLMRFVEGTDRRVEVASLGEADAVVVLGGMVQQVPGVRLGEWGEASDRFEGGIEVFRAGKAPLLIFTGAKMPWTPDARVEGDILYDRALELGVPEAALRVTERVGNTADEAREVRELLGGGRPRVILVTSAFHMRRAAMLFRRAGLEVEEFPVDFRTDVYSERTLKDVLPQVDGLEDSEQAIREMIGVVYYWVRGGAPSAREERDERRETRDGMRIRGGEW
ncbi:YdcF family protein [Prosthecochloris sp. ZM_2]|uniref:YdcF family protein n=1 Tax=Prosthecochloris sp. ZM_2 TaxID=2045206 RepID=UPI000DF76AB5|nr:YdcF family protein [Prosthecochloris sp. ZM_2]RNA71438.1 YdcF family protein [Prosthecochloris sp. ZM_2]